MLSCQCLRKACQFCLIQCHGIARSLLAPVQSRARYLEFHPRTPLSSRILRLQSRCRQSSLGVKPRFLSRTFVRVFRGTDCSRLEYFVLLHISLQWSCGAHQYYFTFVESLCTCSKQSDGSLTRPGKQAPLRRWGSRRPICRDVRKRQRCCR